MVDDYGLIQQAGRNPSRHMSSSNREFSQYVVDTDLPTMDGQGRMSCEARRLR